MCEHFSRLYFKAGQQQLIEPVVLVVSIMRVPPSCFLPVYREWHKHQGNHKIAGSSDAEWPVGNVIDSMVHIYKPYIAHCVDHPQFNIHTNEGGTFKFHIRCAAKAIPCFLA